jgi:xanthine/uracil permease
MFVLILWGWGAVPLMLYAVQHYFSIAGSLILIPLIIVPAMGGTPVSGEHRLLFMCGIVGNWAEVFL